MSHHGNKLEDFEFHDSEITSCIFEGDLLKMDIRMLNVHKDVIEGYDTDMELDGAKIIFRGFRLLKVEEPARVRYSQKGELEETVPLKSYEGKEAQTLVLSRFEENFWVYALSFFDSYWVLEGSRCNHSSEVVNIYFQFDEVEIFWDGFDRPAWYVRNR
ncbi:MAG: hypothetical protein J6M12_09320 [Clostridia bacterium]|nr:hypothetical protein [Clostridia bacterium]